MRSKLKFRMVFAILFTATLLTIKVSYGDTLTITTYPQNGIAKINPANITFTGSLYTNNLWLEDVSVGKTQAAADETFIAKIIAANQNGTAADVLNTWSPEEQSQMATYINNPDLFAANQQWYKTIKYSTPLAKIYFGEFTVFIIQHTMQDSTSIAKLYPIKLVNGTYYMTNLLSDEPIYVYYLPKIKDLTSFKVKPQ